MGFEIVELDGVRYAEIVWGNTRVDHSTFYSPDGSSMQIGLLAHKAGFVEPAHVHKPLTRQIDDLQQMFVVQRGTLAVDFFSDDGRKLREVVLRSGDAILLVHGVHAIRVLEDMQCVTVKQGPFLGAENDKINVEVRS